MKILTWKVFLLDYKCIKSSTIEFSNSWWTAHTHTKMDACFASFSPSWLYCFTVKLHSSHLVGFARATHLLFVFSARLILGHRSARFDARRLAWSMVEVINIPGKSAIFLACLTSLSIARPIISIQGNFMNCSLSSMGCLEARILECCCHFFPSRDLPIPEPTPAAQPLCHWQSV